MARPVPRPGVGREALRARPCTPGRHPLQAGLDRGDGAASRLLAADPRFVAAILPALPGEPEPTLRVTPTASGGKRGTVSCGTFADRFDWTVGEPETVAVKLNAGSE